MLPRKKVGIIFDGHNFTHAVATQGTESVVVALRATMDYIKAMFPGHNVVGMWIDGSPDEYKKFILDHSPSKADARDRSEKVTAKQRIMETETNKTGEGRLRDVEIRYVGKMKRQTGYVEGLLSKSEVYVQSAVDSTVVCDTMECYVSEDFDHVMMFSGDGDLAPVFRTCNGKLRHAFKKAPLRLLCVKGSTAKVFGASGNLLGDLDPVFLDTVPELQKYFVKTGGGGGGTGTTGGGGGDMPVKFFVPLVVVERLVSKPVINVYVSNDTGVPPPTVAPPRKILTQKKVHNIAGFATLKEARALVAEIQKTKMYSSVFAKETKVAYGCEINHDDIPKANLYRPCTVDTRPGKVCYVYHSDDEMYAALDEIKKSKGVPAVPVSMTVDVELCCFETTNELEVRPLKAATAIPAVVPVAVPTSPPSPPPPPPEWITAIIDAIVSRDGMLAPGDVPLFYRFLCNPAQSRFSTYFDADTDRDWVISEVIQLWLDRA